MECLAGAMLVINAAGCSSSSGSGASNSCAPTDQDGFQGGMVPLQVTVTDTGFSPAILTAQNLANVTLTLVNGGTAPHGFALDCLAITPVAPSCPSTSCFPPGATIAPIAPGATATATFTVPDPEGIYGFHSIASGDAAVDSPTAGQFIVK